MDVCAEAFDATNEASSYIMIKENAFLSGI